MENTALIATPNAFVKEHLETRLRPLVIHALSKELGRPIQLAVTVDPSPVAPPEPPPGPPSSPLSPGAPAASDRAAAGPGPAASGHLTARHTRPPIASSTSTTLTTPTTAATTTASATPARPTTTWAAGSPGAARAGAGQPRHAEPAPRRTSGQANGLANQVGLGNRTRPDQPAAEPPGPGGAPPRGRPAQLEVHVRDVRHRLQQPVRARRRGRGRRGPGQGVQPAVHLRRFWPGQDPPAARDRALRADPLQRASRSGT